MSEPDSTEDRLRRRLEKWKRDLIDLTRRNRLLNYKPTRLGTVEVVDELPQQVLVQFVEGGSFWFEPVPEPEKEEEGKDAVGELGPPETKPGLPQLPVEPPEARRLTFAEAQPPAPPESPPPRKPCQGLEIERTHGRELRDHHTDDRLQTKHRKDTLNKRLLRLYRTSRSLIEERGINTLFLALGMLEWYESDTSEERNLAPLILMPVALDREDAGSPFELVLGEDDPVLNPAIVQKLQNDFGIALPGLPELTDDLDADKVFFDIRDTIKHFEHWRVTSDIALGLFDFRKFVMYRDIERYSDRFLGHPALRAIAGERGEGSVTGLPTEIAEADLDEEMSPWDTIQVLDADSSQQRAILAARRGCDLVIEGPPGTGKSQTIANLIGDSLAAGKTVLFVSDKMAALEVVKSRLETVGLGGFCLELHSHRAKKTEFAKEITRSFDRTPQDDSEFDHFLGDLKRTSALLKEYVLALHGSVESLGRSPYQVLEQFVRVEAAQHIRCDLTAAMELHHEQLDGVISRLSDLARALGEVGDPAAHPLRECGLKQSNQNLILEFGDAAREVYQLLNELIAEAQDFATETGFRSPDTLGDVELAVAGSTLIAESPGAEISILQDDAWNSLSTDVSELLEAGRELEELRPGTEGRFRSTILEEDIRPLLRAFCEKLKSGWRWLEPEFWRLRSKLRSFRLDDYQPKDSAQFLSHLEEADRCRDLRNKIRSCDDNGSRLFGARWESDQSDFADLTTFAAWVVEVRQYALKEALEARGFQLAARADVDGDKIRSGAEDLRGLLARCRDAIERLISVANYDDAGRVGSSATASLLAVSAGALDAVEHLEKLPAWAAYRSRLSRVQAGPACDFLDKALELELEPDQLVPSFQRTFYAMWLEEVFQKRPQLGQFRSSDHEHHRDAFQRLDRKSMDIARRKARNTLIAHGKARCADPALSSQLNLVMREARKSRRLLPIRRLLQAAPDIIKAVRPCVMMSPLSLAWYADPDILNFDLLVFDEASQIPPADAVGAIIRAKQMIVVGDSRQLPPTTFFGTQVESEEEDALEGLDDLESILDEAATAVPRSLSS